MSENGLFTRSVDNRSVSSQVGQTWQPDRYAARTNALVGSCGHSHRHLQDTAVFVLHIQTRTSSLMASRVPHGLCPHNSIRCAKPQSLRPPLRTPRLIARTAPLLSRSISRSHAFCIASAASSTHRYLIKMQLVRPVLPIEDYLAPSVIRVLNGHPATPCPRTPRASPLLLCRWRSASQCAHRRMAAWRTRSLVLVLVALVQLLSVCVPAGAWTFGSLFARRTKHEESEYRELRAAVRVSRV